MDEDKTVLISDIFLATHGEGLHIGEPTVLVRCAGCDYQHCIWCDSLQAVLPKHSCAWCSMTPMDIVTRINALTHCNPILVTLSGGNPALQKNLGVVIDMLHAQGHHVTIETQGTVYPDWADKLDDITVSPKPPSSEMETDFAQLDHWVHGKDHVYPVLKVVIFNDRDYAYARSIAERYPRIKMYLQVGNKNMYIVDEALVRYREELLYELYWLQQKVIDDRWYNVTVLPQLHVLLHGSKYTF